MERLESGIPGLDALIEGGFPQGSSVLVSGGPGTGKTILGMQFIYEGAKNNEPGLYVSLESNLKNVVWNMQSFKWDIKTYQDKNLMKIYRLHLNPASSFEETRKQIENELDTIAGIVKEMNAKRLVIDSISALALWIKEEGNLRHMLFSFVDKLKELDATVLLVSETKGGKTDYSRFGVEEFIVDGVLVMYFVPPNRSIFVRKLRGTDHSKTVHPFKISEKGIEISSRDEILWDSIK